MKRETARPPANPVSRGPPRAGAAILSRLPKTFWSEESRQVTPKSSPEEIVKRALDGLEAGQDEVLAAERTLQVKRGLTAATPSYLPQASSGRPSIAVVAIRKH